MSFLEAIVLGIVQGLTEFLPISSTGHLRIVPAFLGWEDPGAAFTAVTQLGTMAAVLLFFREDLARIARAWVRSFRDPAARRSVDGRIGWYIVLGTIPIGIFGILFKDQIETGARDLYLIGAALIVLGLVLLAAEKLGSHDRDLEQKKVKVDGWYTREDATEEIKASQKRFQESDLAEGKEPEQDTSDEAEQKDAEDDENPRESGS